MKCCVYRLLSESKYVSVNVVVVVIVVVVAVVAVVGAVVVKS